MMANKVWTTSEKSLAEVLREMEMFSFGRFTKIILPKNAGREAGIWKIATENIKYSERNLNKCLFWIDFILFIPILVYAVKESRSFVCFFGGV